MYALSTIGSILGTFLPVAFLIPDIGTRRTMLGTAALLALVAVPALGRRYVLVPVAIAMIALLPPGLIKPGSGVIFEGESPYQFVQVVQQSNGTRSPAPERGLGRALGLHPAPDPDRRLLGSVPARPVAPRPAVPEPGDDRLRRRHGRPRVRRLLAEGERAGHRARPAGHRRSARSTSASPATRACTSRRRTAGSTWRRTAAATTRSSWTRSSSPTSPST